MSINKVITLTLGTLLTVCASYKSQKMMAESMDEELSKGELNNIRLVTAFVVSVLVGGVIDSVTGRVFK
ncbi:MAG: hypothetical protein LBN41_01265 [Enterobacteriaceae bacterium]|jgi:F0F1-type ATP synthase assembly protein I|nr:hypothetical protein [Enterobacteriaceae bacterium]